MKFQEYHKIKLKIKAHPQVSGRAAKSLRNKQLYHMDNHLVDNSKITFPNQPA